jgi:hypothetical protein
LASALWSNGAAASEHGQAVKPFVEGQRVFTCGHSFHYFVPAILEQIAEGAKVRGHRTVGLSAIGGSPVNTHWIAPEGKNQPKAALRAGAVDVLTLSPIWLPDPGIEHFATLAAANNPNARVTVQEFWLPNDEYRPVYPLNLLKSVDRDVATIAGLRKVHEPYFRAMDGEVRRLNEKLGKPIVFVVPVGQAVLALREKVVNGQAVGLKRQSELFRDGVGHPTAPIQLLAGYCHFAVIYRRSPVGLPLPGVNKEAKPLFDVGLWTLDVNAPLLARYADADKLNRILQELAWEAVTRHPLSGVVSKKQ